MALHRSEGQRSAMTGVPKTRVLAHSREKESVSPAINVQMDPAIIDQRFIKRVTTLQYWSATEF